GDGLALRLKNRPAGEPIIAIRRFRFRIDAGALFDTPKVIPSVSLEGMRINIPPSEKKPGDKAPAAAPGTKVIIQEALVSDAVLKILPKDTGKIPLEFDIHKLRLESAGTAVAMKYDAT